MISNEIDNIIEESVKNYDGSYKLDSPFEKILSMGELVDRLSIVNFKLYTLKNEVMRKQDDERFRSWASVEDVRLVEERSRLKKCIDKKLSAMIEKYNKTGDTGFNAESKLYK